MYFLFNTFWLSILIKNTNWNCLCLIIRICYARALRFIKRTTTLSMIVASSSSSPPPEKQKADIYLKISVKLHTQIMHVRHINHFCVLSLLIIQTVLTFNWIYKISYCYFNRYLVTCLSLKNITIYDLAIYVNMFLWLIMVLINK